MAYFIAPRSGEKSYKNFQSTIKHGVPYENIEQFLTDEGKSKLLSQDVIYSWGNRAGTRSQWEQMEYGDTVIFYAKGELVMSGEVYYKQHSPELALAMWPPDDNGNPWAYTFFLKNLSYFKMPMRAFNWYAGYANNFVVQGFIPLKAERVAAIEKEHGSIESLLGIFSTPESSEAPTAKDKLYVNVPQQIEITERSSDDLKPKYRQEIIKTTVSKPRKIDHVASNKANAITGSRGEAIAVKYERLRLKELGRHDLSRLVQRISIDDDTFGYDVKSFNADGSDRLIEVKTSSVNSNAIRFYMSANEMKKSKELSDYYVYFVDGINTDSPRVTAIRCPLDDKFNISTDTYLLEAEL